MVAYPSVPWQIACRPIVPPTTGVNSVDIGYIPVIAT